MLTRGRTHHGRSRSHYATCDILFGRNLAHCFLQTVHLELFKNFFFRTFRRTFSVFDEGEKNNRSETWICGTRGWNRWWSNSAHLIGSGRFHGRSYSMSGWGEYGGYGSLLLISSLLTAGCLLAQSILSDRTGNALFLLLNIFQTHYFLLLFSSRDSIYLSILSLTPLASLFVPGSNILDGLFIFISCYFGVVHLFT